VYLRELWPTEREIQDTMLSAVTSEMFREQYADVFRGDERWQLIVRWVLNAQIASEAFGITSKNVDEMKAKSTNSEVRRILGVEGKFGDMMGLSNDWAYNIIKQVGNYGESYERTVGMGSALKLKRGANELWTKGGLLFTPAFQ